MARDCGDNRAIVVSGEGVNIGLRTELKSSTIETIRDQLEFQRCQRPSWVAYHFPEVDRRGMPVGYADVEHMSERRADSVRHLLASTIIYGRGRVRRRKAKTFGLVCDTVEPDDEWSIRLRQLEEALRDLCAVFGLEAPL